MTSRRFFTDSITAPTMVFRPATETRLIFAPHTPIRTGVPGIMATVLSARKTRNVRSAARLPRSIPIVTYLFRCFAAVMSQTHAQKDNTQTQTHERERETAKRKKKETTSYFDELSPRPHEMKQINLKECNTICFFCVGFYSFSRLRVCKKSQLKEQSVDTYNMQNIYRDDIYSD